MLHKEQVSPDLIDQWKEFLSLLPAYEDDYLIAYHTDLKMGRDYAFAYTLTPTLGLVRVRVSPVDEVCQGAFVVSDIYWGAAEPPGRDLAVRVEFIDHGGAVAQVEQKVLYPDWRSAQWLPNTIVVGRYRVQVDAHLPPGEYNVQVSAVDLWTGEQVGQPAVVATLKVQPACPVEQGY